MTDFMYETRVLESTSDLASSKGNGLADLPISKRLNRRRKSPSILTERSGKTKKPPSKNVLSTDVTDDVEA